jgi:hypothetical protein
VGQELARLAGLPGIRRPWRDRAATNCPHEDAAARWCAARPVSGGHLDTARCACQATLRSRPTGPRRSSTDSVRGSGCRIDGSGVTTLRRSHDASRDSDELEDPRERGALLRREGLYHSHIEYWRAARDKGALAELEPLLPVEAACELVGQAVRDRWISPRSSASCGWSTSLLVTSSADHLTRSELRKRSSVIVVVRLGCGCRRVPGAA